MKIAVLGTVGYHPTEDRQTTSVLIPNEGIAFDAGTSFFRLPQYLATDTLDIFLTHAHVDHVVGLTYLLGILHQRPMKTVRVHGTRKTLDAIRRHLFSKELFPVEPVYQECPLEESTMVGEAKVTHIDLMHPGGSVGYRVDWPQQSLAFITDTTATLDASYVEFIHDVDLLIHECNFPDGMEELAAKTGHSSLSAVVEVAKHAQVGGLVLLHFDPVLPAFTQADAAKLEDKFAPIVFAEDGMEIEF